MLTVTVNTNNPFCYPKTQMLPLNLYIVGNLLVTSSDEKKYVIKVADFGLSRVVDEDKEYYKTTNGEMAVKWAPPEALQYGKFSSKSGNFFQFFQNEFNRICFRFFQFCRIC